MRPLDILTWPTHGSHLCYLSQLPHRLHIVCKPGRPAGYGGRCGHMPWGDNVFDCRPRRSSIAASIASSSRTTTTICATSISSLRPPSGHGIEDLAVIKRAFLEPDGQLGAIRQRSHGE